MDDRVRFILDGQVRELEDVDPTRTVLDWLRNVEGRRGTKEGCAEGDCGACTVVLADLHRGAVRYRAVDACILFLPALDGKALLTVESVCRAAPPLHPVQRAMVDCHASQCGFCTPGFVMSLVALYESEPAPSRERIQDVVAGNLCRCTGYRPIVAAAEQAYAHGGGPRLAAHEARLAELLRSVARTEGLALEREGRRFFAPRTLDAACELLERHPAAVVLAGGTDVGVTVTKQHRDLETVVSIAEVAGLSDVRVTDAEVEIGGAATYADAHAPLAAVEPDLATLLRRIASQQIRNVATVAGNLATASPVGDASPALLALDARVVLRLGRERREVPLDVFFVGYRRTALRPGELIERIVVPRRGGRRFRAYKVSKRFDQDISAVCGAFSVELEAGAVRDVRVSFGGMAATPARARACEAALRGKPWTEATVEAALPALDAELSPISDHRAGAAYRRLVARNLLRKFQRDTAVARPAGRPVAVAEGA